MLIYLLNKTLERDLNVEIRSMRVLVRQIKKKEHMDFNDFCGVKTMNI